MRPSVAQGAKRTKINRLADQNIDGTQHSRLNMRRGLAYPKQTKVPREQRSIDWQTKTETGHNIAVCICGEVLRTRSKAKGTKRIAKKASVRGRGAWQKNRFWPSEAAVYALRGVFGIEGQGGCQLMIPPASATWRGMGTGARRWLNSH